MLKAKKEKIPGRDQMSRKARISRTCLQVGGKGPSVRVCDVLVHVSHKEDMWDRTGDERLHLRVQRAYDVDRNRLLA